MGRPHDLGVVGPVVTIEGLATGGRGVARVEGKVWLVAGGLPGDRVETRIRADRGRYVEAVATAVVTPSPERRVPVCPLQGDCGGCAWMPLGEAVQREWKRRIVLDALRRIGGFADPPVEPIRAPGPALRYRNRVEFTVGPARSGARAIGLHPADSASRVVDVERCFLESEEADAILATVREFVLAGPGASDEAWDDAGHPVRVAVRGSASTGAAVVVFRTGAAPIRTLEALADRLMERHPSVRGVVRVRTVPGRRGGGTTEAIRGDGRVDERAGGLPVRVPAGTFTQVHEQGAALLTDLVVEDAGVPRRAIELFGGVGGFGFALARGGARVTVVEADPDAVAAGRSAAAEAGLADRVAFVIGRAEHVLGTFEDGTEPPDVIVADPPRTGLKEPLAVRIASLAAPRIVLVSCDPATFARDARVLVREGYRLGRVVPVDLFPQTPHVETVARFSRAEEAPRRSMRGSTPPRASGSGGTGGRRGPAPPRR